MIEVDFLGEGALGEVEPAALPPAPPVPLTSNTLPRTRRLTLVEIEAASTAPVVSVELDADALGGEALGEDVLGGVPIPEPAVRPVTTVRGSDLGYRSSATDAGGVQPYRPILIEGLAVNREMPLLPAQTAAGAAWGEVRLLNSDRALTAVARGYSPAGRPLRVRWGYKGWDAARGVETDPQLSALGLIFGGVGAAWNLGDRTLDVTLRDATWFAERALQVQLYGGTGGLEGPAALAGLPKPKLRGGTPASPVRDIEPVLVDPVALIYQINDARAVITTLYEAGDGTRIPFQADVSDLYAGTTNPGEYRTDAARGLFQLGREPAGRITCDAYGATLGGNFEANGALLALALLCEDLTVPLDQVEQSSFLALAPAWPFPVGWYWRDAVPAGLDAVAALLSSCNAALVPRRDGRLGVVPRRRAALPPAPAVVDVLTPGTLAAGVTFAREQPGGSVATWQDVAGVWREAAANTPRWNGSRRRLLREREGRNEIRNPRCVGAVVGTVGSGGALPTHWSVTLSAGLATQVLSTQTVNGVETVTLRISGTTTGIAYLLQLEATGIIAAAPSAPFALAIFARVDAAPTPPANYRLIAQGRTIGNAVVAGDIIQSVPSLTDFQRFALEGSFSSDPTIARMLPFFGFVPTTVGDAIDVTITLGWPTYDRRLSTPILPAPATIAASARGADVITYALPASRTGYTVQIAAAPAATPAAGEASTLAQIDAGSDAERVTIGAGVAAGSMQVERAAALSVASAPLPGVLARDVLTSLAVAVEPSGAVRATARGQASAALAGGPTGVTTLRLGQGAGAEWAGEIEAVTVREGALSTPALANQIGPSFAAEPIRMVILYGQSRADNRSEGQTVYLPFTRTAQRPDLALRMRGPSSPGLPFERAYEARWTDRFEPMRDNGAIEFWPALINGIDQPAPFQQLGQSAGSLLWRLVDKDAAAGIPPRRWLYLAAGIGGARIAQLSKGVTVDLFGGTFSPYQRLLDAVTQANTVARTVYGVPLIVEAVAWAQGEGDGLSGTPPATYQAALAQLVNDLPNDLQSITGQARVPFFVTDLVTPSGLGTGENTVISQAQEAAVLADTTGRLHAFGPVYQYPFFDFQHMTTTGVVSWGEAIAEAIYPLITSGVAPNWVRRGPISVVGSTITIPTIGAQGNLVLDTTTVPLAPNHGFNLSGTAATITGVSVSGTTITITCSAGPSGGTLHYAGILAGGNGNGATGFAGAYGNVRDSYGLPSVLVPGVTLRRFLASFVVTL